MQPLAAGKAATNAGDEHDPAGKDPSKKGTAIAMAEPAHGRGGRVGAEPPVSKGAGKTYVQLRGRRGRTAAPPGNAGGSVLKHSHHRCRDGGGLFPLHRCSTPRTTRTSPQVLLGCTTDRQRPLRRLAFTAEATLTSRVTSNMLQGTMAFSVNTYFVGTEQQVGLCRIGGHRQAAQA